MNADMLIWLFPLVFMVHEFEEIIFFKWWIGKNRDELARRFPVLSMRLLPYLEGMSTVSFAFVAAEEFILVTLGSLGAYWFSNYNLFAGMVIGYGIHLAVHLVQFCIYRRYIPALVTSVATGIYSGYVIRYFCINGLIQAPDVVIYSLASIVVIVCNLALFHWIAGKLNI